MKQQVGTITNGNNKQHFHFRNFCIITICISLCALYLFYITTDPYNINNNNHNYNHREYNANLDTLKLIDDDNVSRVISKDGYVVWSQSCQIPNISAYDKSIEKLVKKEKKIKCSQLERLTFIKYGQKYPENKNKLVIDKKQISKYTRKKSKVIECCYSNITRNHITLSASADDDNRYKVGPSVCFKSETSLPNDTEFIFVACFMKIKSQKKKEIYRNVHAIVKRKNEINNGNGKPNVLMLGIDSVSRLNLIRTMPKTVKYLENNGWLSLQGYTKIDDNTFPNLIAILTGLKVSQLPHNGYTWKEKMDDNPLIWKTFKNNSYLTTYIEDEPEVGTFNYCKYGFMNSPTDFYFRPFLLAAEHFLKIGRHGGMKYCLGPESTVDHIFRYMLDFVKLYENASYFSFIWTNSFSHNDLNMPTIMDDKVRDVLNSINPYLNNTIVIFLSDHGIRFGKIRETFVGWLEERMPFIYFYLPQSFIKKYPQKYENLKFNKNRLTNPFDLHLTLLDILNGDDEDVYKNGTKGCGNCKSLFKKVDVERSCDDISIDAHWCTCFADNLPMSKNMHDKEIITNASNYIVKDINKYIGKKSKETDVGYRCADLDIGEIKSVYSKVGGNKSVIVIDYVIMLTTTPNKGLYEATVRHFNNNNTFIISGSISRINYYNTDGHCIHNANAKKYCFCVKMLKQNDTNNTIIGNNSSSFKNVPVVNNNVSNHH